MVMEIALREKPTNEFVLSDRERLIMQLVFWGKGTREIAEALYIAYGIVEHDLRSIIDKLGINRNGKTVSLTQPIEQTTLFKPKIVASIPCYNEERYITDLVSRVRKYVDQVIVVDDGSSDSTAKEAIEAGALILNHMQNKGYGEAIKSCFNGAKLSGADILVTIDGDNQHRPEEIPNLLEPIIKGEADIVIGSRLMSESPKQYQEIQKDSIPGYRRFGINVISFLCNCGSKAKISDTQSGFRAYRRDVIDDLSLDESGMGISVELLIKAVDKGYAIKEVPISCRYHAESSTSNPVLHGFGVAFTTLKVRFKGISKSRLSTSN